MNKIYTIVMFSGSGSHRVWSWHSTFDKAFNYLKDHPSYVEDGTYKYALIEEIEEGFSIAKQVAWFKIDVISEENSKYSYMEIPAPEFVFGIVNFSIG